MLQQRSVQIAKYQDSTEGLRCKHTCAGDFKVHLPCAPLLLLPCEGWCLQLSADLLEARAVAVCKDHRDAPGQKVESVPARSTSQVQGGCPVAGDGQCL